MPDPLLPGRAGLYLSMLHYGLTGYADFAREHVEFYRRLRAYIGEVRGLRVLDVGCGKSFWLSLLLASDGAQVVGVDTELVEPSRGLSKYRHILSNNGIERTVRTAVWDALFAGPYYRVLEREFGKPLRFDALTLQTYDGVNLDQPDNSFDLVVSHEVFEHVSKPADLLRTLSRVMKPDARTYIYVHNFTSLSGGHHIAWKHPDSRPSKRVPPWDHLRQRRYADIPSWLNGLREHEYRKLFEEGFEVLDWVHSGREGEKLFSPEIRAELGQYSTDELLTKGFIIVARPRKAAIAITAGGSSEASA